MPVVFLISIALILLQKVIPCHKNKNNNSGMVPSSPFCKRFGNDHNWNPRDIPVPVNCRWPKGHGVEAQAVSHPLHTSFVFYSGSAHKEKRQTV